MIREEAGETPAEIFALVSLPEDKDMMFFAANKDYASRKDRSEDQVVKSLQHTLALRKK